LCACAYPDPFVSIRRSRLSVLVPDREFRKCLAEGLALRLAVEFFLAGARLVREPARLRAVLSDCRPSFACAFGIRRSSGASSSGRYVWGRLEPLVLRGCSCQRYSHAASGDHAQWTAESR